MRVLSNELEFRTARSEYRLCALAMCSLRGKMGCKVTEVASINRLNNRSHACACRYLISTITTPYVRSNRASAALVPSCCSYRTHIFEFFTFCICYQLAPSATLQILLSYGGPHLTQRTIHVYMRIIYDDNNNFVNLVR